MVAVKIKEEKKALCILRVSSDEQARKGASLESQEEWMKKIAQQMGLKVVKTFKVVVSGETFPKKYFDEIVNLVQKEQILYILVYAIDRFARNLPYGAYLLEKLREIGDIKLVTSTGVFDLNNHNHRTQIWLALLMAEMEQGSREERTMRGMITKLKKGEWPLSPPFGYETVDGRLRLIQEYKPVIIFIFDTFIKTKSYTQTARLTNEKYGKNMGFELTLNKVKKIIHDNIYIGYLRWNGMLFGEGDKNKPKEDLKIIDKKMFNIAQAVAARIGQNYTKRNNEILVESIEEYGMENIIEILNLKPTCPKCNSYNVQRNGKEKNQLKFICKECGHQFRIPSKKQTKKLKEKIWLTCPRCNSKNMGIIRHDSFFELKCMDCGHSEMYERFIDRRIGMPKLNKQEKGNKKRRSRQQTIDNFS